MPVGTRTIKSAHHTQFEPVKADICISNASGVTTFPQNLRILLPYENEQLCCYVPGGPLLGDLQGVLSFLAAVYECLVGGAIVVNLLHLSLLIDLFKIIFLCALCL